VQPGDRALLTPGAVFRLAIGYERTVAGTQQRVTKLVFRRLPRWTRRELADADLMARRLGDAIRVE
jgi:hypothetical protein